MDDQRARQLLEAERDRLLAIERDTRRSLETAQGDSTSELSTFDQHPGDIGTETHERERDASVLENVREQLADIDRAFQRLQDGTYGICEATGERIPDERLEVMPQARYTVEAQAEMERRARAGTGRSDAVPPRPES
jgi:DnaK suppressor protein